MAIKGVSDQVRMPRLGKIHLGIKVEEEGKSPYPRPTDYFVVPQEVQDVYGDRPTKLDIMFPGEDPEKFASQFLRYYSRTQGLVCIGDGEKSRRKVDVETGAMANRDTDKWEWKDNLPCDPQNCLEYSTKHCRRVMNLLVLLPKVKGLGVWQIDTSSFYSIINVNSMVQLLKGVAGRCSLIPLTLELAPIEVSPQGISKKTVRVLQLKQELTLAETARIAAEPHKAILLPEPETEEAPEDLFPEKMLERTKDVVAPEEERVIELDVSLIKTQHDFEQACFESLDHLKPEPALKLTGTSEAEDIRDWGEAFLQVATILGYQVVGPST